MILPSPTDLSTRERVVWYSSPSSVCVVLLLPGFHSSPHLSSSSHTNHPTLWVGFFYILHRCNALAMPSFTRSCEHGWAPLIFGYRSDFSMSSSWQIMLFHPTRWRVSTSLMGALSSCRVSSTLCSPRAPVPLIRLHIVTCALRCLSLHNTQDFLLILPLSLPWDIAWNRYSVYDDSINT